MKTPSDKQIDLADRIAEELGLDFPKSSNDFTAYAYFHFIKEHINSCSYESSDDAEFDGEAFVMGLWEY